MQSMSLQSVGHDLVTEQHPVSGLKHGHLLRCHRKGLSMIPERKLPTYFRPHRLPDAQLNLNF